MNHSRRVISFLIKIYIFARAVSVALMLSLANILNVAVAMRKKYRAAFAMVKAQVASHSVIFPNQIQECVA